LWQLNSFYYVVGDQVLRFFLTGDQHFNALTFDTTTGGKFAAELLPQSRASDASNADLTRFAQHGGKFLMLHGTAEATIPTDASVMYYKMVQGKMSQDRWTVFCVSISYRALDMGAAPSMRALMPLACLIAGSIPVSLRRIFS
jgi:Tannase and feruloyl esterase